MGTSPPDNPWDSTRFVNEPADELVCSICLCVLNKPIETPCRHCFCRACLERWLETGNRCPQCDASVQLDGLRPVLPTFQNLINGLRVRCENHPNGCRQEFSLEEYSQGNHIAVCRYRDETLPAVQGSCRGCQELEIKVRELEKQVTRLSSTIEDLTCTTTNNAAPQADEPVLAPAVDLNKNEITSRKNHHSGDKNPPKEKKKKKRVIPPPPHSERINQGASTSTADEPRLNLSDIVPPLVVDLRGSETTPRKRHRSADKYDVMLQTLAKTLGDDGTPRPKRVKTSHSAASEVDQASTTSDKATTQADGQLPKPAPPVSTQTQKGNTSAGTASTPNPPDPKIFQIPRNRLGGTTGGGPAAKQKRNSLDVDGESTGRVIDLNDGNAQVSGNTSTSERAALIPTLTEIPRLVTATLRRLPPRRRPMITPRPPVHNPLGGASGKEPAAKQKRSPQVVHASSSHLIVNGTRYDLKGGNTNTQLSVTGGGVTINGTRYNLRSANTHVSVNDAGVTINGTRYDMNGRKTGDNGGNATSGPPPDVAEGEQEPEARRHAEEEREAGDAVEEAEREARRAVREQERAARYAEREEIRRAVGEADAQHRDAARERERADQYAEREVREDRHAVEREVRHAVGEAERAARYAEREEREAHEFWRRQRAHFARRRLNHPPLGQEWNCQHCTYRNEAANEVCEVCTRPRYPEPAP